MDEAKRLFELFSKEIEAILATSDRVLVDQHILAIQEDMIKTKQQEIETKSLELKKEKEIFEGEKLFFNKSVAESNIKSQQLQKQKDEIEHILVQLEEKKREIKGQQDILDLKIKSAQDLDEKLATLQEKEQLIAKKEAIDKERKEMLDFREMALNAKANRLQKMSENMST